MLGSYSRDDEDVNISENGVNLNSGSSRPQQSSNLIGEDFRSLLNTNSRENSEIAIDTTRLINEEISNHMSRKLNEIKTSLNSQIQDAITSRDNKYSASSYSKYTRNAGETWFYHGGPRVQRATS